jgi:hypothetical protein
MPALHPTFFGENDPRDGSRWNRHDVCSYLSPFERWSYELTVDQAGRLSDASGNSFSTRAWGRTPGDGPIYVVTDDGRIYVENHPVIYRFHHSSFVAGGSVLCGGELVVQRGVLEYITNHSGHYLPTAQDLRDAIAVLRNKGVAQSPTFSSQGC